jgi:16S rRNA (adenine1518-N6/adenine1519-N6)-dimethyltransferase
MRPRRRFAQHFLEPAWVAKLVDTLAPAPTDVVLEIGPGRGAVTFALAPRVQRLTVVEVDRDLAAGLRARVPENVTVVEGDVLRLDLVPILRELEAAARPDGRLRIVGNLPYNISSPILFRLVDLVRTGVAAHDATIMLQREVADRVAARPGSGDWGPLGIAIQVRADVTRVLDLPPGAFRPPPRVQSSVVHLRFVEPRVPLPGERVFDSLVRALFTQRRKTIQNALRPFATARGLEPAALLASAGLEARRRPETFSLEELARLAALVS